jgi:hypothetical protein
MLTEDIMVSSSRHRASNGKGLFTELVSWFHAAMAAKTLGKTDPSFSPL